MTDARLTAKALMMALALLAPAAARAQAPAGIPISSLTRWPPYVYDTDTLNKGRIVFSTVGGLSHTAGTLRNETLYSGFEIGATDRLLIAFAGSTSFSNRAATKLDDVVVHARYRFSKESTGKPAFAIAVNIQRQAFLRGTSISPYEGQLMIISEKALGRFALFGQAGYTTRNQPFEGIGFRRTIGERLILTGNYSYRHGRLIGGFPLLPTLPSRPTSSVVYVTAYYSLSDRVGLTCAAGRTFPSHSDSGGFTRFFSCGFGIALKK